MLAGYLIGTIEPPEFPACIGPGIVSTVCLTIHPAIFSAIDSSVFTLDVGSLGVQIISAPAVIVDAIERARIGIEHPLPSTVGIHHSVMGHCARASRCRQSDNRQSHYGSHDDGLPADMIHHIPPWV
jgi:hypothetical protein